MKVCPSKSVKTNINRGFYKIYNFLKTKKVLEPVQLPCTILHYLLLPSNSPNIKLEEFATKG